MSIYHFLHKIKWQNSLENLKHFAIPLIIILTALGSFGLGRLSVIENTDDFIFINTPDNPSDLNLEANVLSSEVLRSGGQVVASKTGTKYHFPWCAGARSIAEGNQVWFNTKVDAEKAGYEPASNCRGLK